MQQVSTAMSTVARQLEESTDKMLALQQHVARPVELSMQLQRDMEESSARRLRELDEATPNGDRARELSAFSHMSKTR